MGASSPPGFASPPLQPSGGAQLGATLALAGAQGLGEDSSSAQKGDHLGWEGSSPSPTLDAGMRWTGVWWGQSRVSLSWYFSSRVRVVKARLPEKYRKGKVAHHLGLRQLSRVPFSCCCREERKWATSRARSTKFCPEPLAGGTRTHALSAEEGAGLMGCVQEGTWAAPGRWWSR